MPSPLLAKPPWQLLSPSGVLHFTRDQEALKELADDDDLYHDLCKLVGLRVERKGAKALPQHKAQWQLLERIDHNDNGSHIGNIYGMPIYRKHAK